MFFVKMNFWHMWPLYDPWGHLKYNLYSYLPGMIAIKHWNPIKCVEEETDCKK